MRGGCDCDLCKKEADWEEEFGSCYRCTHDIPCPLAQAHGEKCCTVLDEIAARIR